MLSTDFFMSDKKPAPKPQSKKPSPASEEKAQENRSPESEASDLSPGHDLPDHPSSRPLRQDMILNVQRSLGNRSARELIDKDRSGDTPEVMGQWPFESRTYSVEAILRDRTPDDIGELSDEQIRAASLQQKMALVHLINWGNVWVGPENERQVERIWRIVSENQEEFGRALEHFPNYFKESVEFGAEIEHLEPIPTLKRQFRTDVKGLASGYLDSNEQMILSELERVGLPNPNEMQAPTMAANPLRESTSTGPSEMNEPMTARVQEIQAIAAQVRRAQLAQRELERIPVGYGFTGDPRYRMGAIGRDMQEWARDLYGTHPQLFQVATYDPSMLPEIRPFGNEQPPFHDYDEVKPHHDELSARIAEFASNYPTIHALIQAERVEEFALGSLQEARQVMAEVLQGVLSNILTTRPRLSSDDLDYRDLTPIHHQMRQGQVAAPSGNNYQSGISRAVMDLVLEDHETTEFWISIGLGTLAAAAFLVAEFATLGSATFILATGVGLTASATQAGRSWENYEELATAADATVSDEMQLVSQSQADAALMGAVLDTVFLFLDMAAPAIRWARDARAAARGTAIIEEAAQAGERAIGLESLAALGAGAGHESRELVARAITNLGVEETIQRSGKSLDELLAIVGENSDAGRRLLAFRQVGAGAMRSTQELAELLPNLASDVAGGVVREGREMTPQLADEIVQQAIERLGPQRTLELTGGWKKLSSLLGNNAGSADRLLAWRDGIMADLAEFVNRDLRGDLEEGVELIRRTGSEDFTSDLDISLLGPNAAANRQHAMSFLAGRLGAPRENLSRLLYTDLFTDPRRMHLYDLIPDASLRERIAAEAAGFEREVIWNRRLYDALQANDRSLAATIREQMRQLGVREVGYTPINAEEIHRMSVRIDSLHQELDAARRVGDTARQGELATEIARNQALINAAEGGGYFSGGGVRRSVSQASGEFEGFPGFTQAEIATEARRMLPTQDFMHVLDQLPKLDEEIRSLRRLAGMEVIPPDRLSAALKGIGKYGERLTEVAGPNLGGEVPARRIMEAFGDQFSDLIAAARRTEGATLATQIATNSDDLVRRTEVAIRNYEAASADILRILQNRATITTPGITGANLRNVQIMVRAHTGFLRLSDNVLFHLRHAARLIRTRALPPGREGDASVGGGESEE